jgi:hypothetical protein
MREDGHVFFGEAYVVPRTTEDLAEKIEKCSQHARSLNWRLHDLVIMPVRRLPILSESTSGSLRSAAE